MLATGISCFALVWVRGRRREPSPPDRTSAFTRGTPWAPRSRAAGARSSASRRPRHPARPAASPRGPGRARGCAKYALDDLRLRLLALLVQDHRARHRRGERRARDDPRRHVEPAVGEHAEDRRGHGLRSLVHDDRHDVGRRRRDRAELRAEVAEGLRRPRSAGTARPRRAGRASRSTGTCRRRRRCRSARPAPSGSPPRRCSRPRACSPGTTSSAGLRRPSSTTRLPRSSGTSVGRRRSSVGDRSLETTARMNCCCRPIRAKSGARSSHGWWRVRTYASAVVPSKRWHPAGMSSPVSSSCIGYGTHMSTPSSASTSPWNPARSDVEHVVDPETGEVAHRPGHTLGAPTLDPALERRVDLVRTPGPGSRPTGRGGRTGTRLPSGPAPCARG